MRYVHHYAEAKVPEPKRGAIALTICHLWILSHACQAPVGMNATNFGSLRCGLLASTAELNYLFLKILNSSHHLEWVKHNCEPCVQRMAAFLYTFQLDRTSSLEILGQNGLFDGPDWKSAPPGFYWEIPVQSNRIIQTAIDEKQNIERSLMVPLLLQAVPTVFWKA